ncbi:MAG TPA: hypothetical protein VLE51_02820 [Candidatus Saccharimonadales bacterium]|nr:hypothetical protein [Candidatus Saccharimonadales bacterium]
MSDNRPRNRNPSNGSSKAALRYYRSAERSASSPFDKKTKPRRRKSFSRLVDFLLLIALLSGAAYTLVVKSSPKVVLNSSVYRPVSTYQEASVKEFKKIKNRNKLTMDEKAIITSLQRQFPEIVDGRIDLLILSTKPTVRLNIASPSFTLNSRGVDYIVDSQGVAVIKASELPKIKDLPKVIDQSGFDIKQGQQVLSATSVNFINIVSEQAKHAGVTIASLTLPQLAQEVDMRTADRGYFVKFYLGGDGLLQAGQFLASRRQFDQTSTQPSQYLDVRVPGKVYYK